MSTVLLLAVASILLYSAISNLTSQINRMSLAFQVSQKPYTPKPKPKGDKGKGKFKQDLFALVKYAGTGAIGISGKIAGTVFTTSGSNGAFIRVWAKPRNVKNSLTQMVRGIFSGISSAWTTLTPSQISAWNAAANLYLRTNVFGDIRSLKGNTAFQRVNNILTSLGLANVVDPPAIVGPTFNIVSATAAASLAGTSFDITITEFGGAVVLPAGHYIKAYGTTMRPASQSSFSKPAYKYFGFYSPTDSTNPLDIYADYIAKFGTLEVGTKVSIALEVILSATGGFHKSGLYTVECIVGA